jgi:capsular exopolysaccharide synthesis family protein
VTIAQAGKRVVLLDCDLRKPNQHILLDAPNTSGLSSYLRCTALLGEALQHTRFAGLDLITGGPQATTPLELVGSPRMIQLLEDLTDRYDYVILDAPAFLPVADASILAPLVDSVILVVRRTFISQAAVREVCKHLGYLHARITGVFVNQSEPAGSRYDYRRN